MLPVVLSIVGGMLPMIVDAFRSGRSPEEAAKIVAPKRQEIVERLIGSGMAQYAAEAMADESIKGELEKAQLPEPMNPWLSTALMAAGAFGGYKLGGAIAGKMAAANALAAKPKNVSTPNKATPKAKTPAAEEVREAGAGHNAAEEMAEGASSDISNMGKTSNLTLSTDISQIGKTSPIPPSRGNMRAMSEPTRDIVPSYTDTPFPPRDRFGGVASELSPLPGPSQVPEWVRGAPNPAASVVDDMVAKGPFPATMHGSVTPSRLQPGLTDRDMQIEEIMKQMQMEEMRAARMAAMPQAPPRSMRTVGDPLIPPWER